MEQAAEDFTAFLIIVLLIGMVSRAVWWWRRRAANHEMRAQAERDFAARAAGQLDENERRYGSPDMCGPPPARRSRTAAQVRFQPETTLMQTHGLARRTVRKAIDALEEVGLIVRVQGRGTFVV